MNIEREREYSLFVWAKYGLNVGENNKIYKK